MIVLTHIGQGLPEYVNICLKQIRYFNNNIEIYFITNNDNIVNNKNYWNENKVITVSSESLHNERIDKFSRLLNNGWSTFWTNSATRILYLEEFLKTNNKPIIHFENDVLIYCDLKDVLDKSEKVFNRLGLTQGGFDRFMTGMFFIKDYESLNLLTNYWIEILENRKVDELYKKYNLDMINEMSLFLIYYMEKGCDYMDTFPSLPVGEKSKNLNYYNSIFDPATYGQYVGGTPIVAGGAPPGYIDKNHYVGNFMLENMGKWEFYFNEKKPYLIFEDKEYRINNLHIHSKNLHLYESYTR